MDGQQARCVNCYMFELLDRDGAVTVCRRWSFMRSISGIRSASHQALPDLRQPGVSPRLDQ